jgi:hypothetical protein
MKVKSGQQISEEFITRQWKKFANKWHIPPLTPKDGRHWVATTTRKEGLSPQASALIMGHDLSNIGEGMRAAYDHPHIREWLQEQKLVLPKGCLGTLELQAQILVIPQDISFKIEQVITEYTTTSMPLRVATEKIGDILESYKNTILKERLLTV